MATVAYRISIHAAHSGSGCNFDHTFPFASDQPVIPADGQTPPAAWVTEYIRQVVDSVTVTGPDSDQWKVRVWLDYLPLPIVVPAEVQTRAQIAKGERGLTGTDHLGMMQAGSPFNASDSVARRTGRFTDFSTMWLFDISTRQLTFQPDHVPAGAGED